MEAGLQHGSGDAVASGDGAAMGYNLVAGSDGVAYV